MFKHYMLLVRITLTALLTVSAIGVAGEKDFDLPIKVDAQSNFFDGKTKTSIFTKDVKITQGSLIILADEVKVIAGLGEGKEVFIARGEPASYQQELEGGTSIRAAANEIKYEVSNRTLTLTGNAELKQDSSQVRGESIVFNMVLEQLIAQGDDSKEGGVTTIFQPDSLRKKEKDSEKEQEQEKEQEKEKSQDDKP